jgi:hypothetical protein
LLDANPLVSVGNLTRSAGVIVRGQCLPKSEIDRQLADLAERIALRYWDSPRHPSLLKLGHASASIVEYSLGLFEIHRRRPSVSLRAFDIVTPRFQLSLSMQ